MCVKFQVYVNSVNSLLLKGGPFSDIGSNSTSSVLKIFFRSLVVFYEFVFLTGARCGYFEK